jgi:hypothetical protein
MDDDFPVLEVTYNRSELRAFKSGRGVSDYLNALRQRFPNHSLSVCAHSMGNVVMMEALKHDVVVGRTNIDNYVVMQGAVPAHCYDASLTNYSRFIPYEQVAPTPDTYRSYLGALNQAVRSQIVNFFNANDYALATGPFGNWEVNQITFKPDSALGYEWNGTNAFKDLVQVDDSREIMSFVARPRSKAIGAVAGVAGCIEVDLTTTCGFKDSSFEHSAQFNWQIQTASGFYHAFLTTLFPPE